jgi:hypothetical protein
LPVVNDEEESSEEIASKPEFDRISLRTAKSDAPVAVTRSLRPSQSDRPAPLEPTELDISLIETPLPLPVLEMTTFPFELIEAVSPKCH